MMASTVSIFHAVCYLFVQIIVMNVVTCETSIQHDNSTISALKRNSGRLKRSLDEIMPDVLKIRVRYANGEEIDLNWVKKTKYLANQHLPVRLSFGHLKRNVMKDVGEFALYHDLERCSSVAYFKNTNTFIGYLGMNYLVNELLYKFDANGNYPGVVGAPYIIKRPEQLTPDQFNVDILPHSMSDIGVNVVHSLDDNFKRINQCPANTNPGPSPKYRRPKGDFDQNNYEEVTDTNTLTNSNMEKRRKNPLSQNFYSEILVFITDDVADMFKTFYTSNHYITWIVKYCIRHFNAVDSFFQTRTRKFITMNINIAKIVILDSSQVLPSTNNGEIRFLETVAKLRKYLNERRLHYTPDSFDHVFVITSNRIIHNSVRVPGKTDYSANLYEKRDEGQFYNAIPITVVEFASSYVHAVHEISQVLNIEVGPSLEEMEKTGRCYSIMQEGSTMCNRCLKWSDVSEQQFINFFKTNYNRCFLMNEPRSLRPPGPSRFLTPLKQCQCFGYDSHVPNSRGGIKWMLAVSECDVALQCQKVVDDKPYLGYVLPPFDGTCCGRINQVCWNGKCTVYNRSPDTRRKKKN